MSEQTQESQRYQIMLQKVEGLVSEISSGKLELDDMVDKVEQGYDLIKMMRQRLNATKSKVDKMREEFEEESSS